jgi:ubiquitin C-terminal hydrolase
MNGNPNNNIHRRIPLERIDSDVTPSSAASFLKKSNGNNYNNQQHGNNLNPSSTIPGTLNPLPKIVFVPARNQQPSTNQHNGNHNTHNNNNTNKPPWTISSNFSYSSSPGLSGMKLESPRLAALSINGSTTTSNNNNNNNPTLTSNSIDPIHFFSRGLINRGATCYLNSIVQGLLHCAPFTMFLIRKLPTMDNSTHTNSTSQHRDALDVMREHVLLSCDQPTNNNKKLQPAIDPIRLLKILKPNQRGASCRQEDSHEALRLLLEAMQRACLSRLGYSPLLSDSRSETTYVHQIFGGVITTATTCPSCKRESSKSDAFLDLSLDLAKTIPLAIAKLLKEETLTNDNKWRCESCNQLVCATRKPAITKAPLVLVIHLKRFAYTIHGRTKLRDPVFIPIQFDLPCLLGKGSSNNGNQTSIPYDLVAEIIHVGRGPNSGHYYSRIRSPRQQQQQHNNNNCTTTWIEYDDDILKIVPEQLVSNEPNGYIMFYVKRGYSSFTSHAIETLTESPLLPRLVGGQLQQQPTQVPQQPTQVPQQQQPLPKPPIIQQQQPPIIQQQQQPILQPQPIIIPPVTFNSHNSSDDDDDDDDDYQDQLLTSQSFSSPPHHYNSWKSKFTSIRYALELIRQIKTRSSSSSSNNKILLRLEKNKQPKRKVIHLSQRVKNVLPWKRGPNSASSPISSLSSTSPIPSIISHHMNGNGNHSTTTNNKPVQPSPIMPTIQPTTSIQPPASMNTTNNHIVSENPSLFSFDMTEDERRMEYFTKLKKRKQQDKTNVGYDEWDKRLDMGRARKRKLEE